MKKITSAVGSFFSGLAGFFSRFGEALVKGDLFVKRAARGYSAACSREESAACNG